METYRWSTIEYHPDNNYTMQDYLNNRLPDHFDVIFEDGTYVEIVNKLNGSIWGVNASGDGDSYHHKVEFEYTNRVIMDGGQQIADTGDYGDCFCPVCDNSNLDEKEPDLQFNLNELRHIAVNYAISCENGYHGDFDSWFNTISNEWRIVANNDIE